MSPAGGMSANVVPGMHRQNSDYAYMGNMNVPPHLRNEMPQPSPRASPSLTSRAPPSPPTPVGTALPQFWSLPRRPTTTRRQALAALMAVRTWPQWDGNRLPNRLCLPPDQEITHMSIPNLETMETPTTTCIIPTPTFVVQTAPSRIITTLVNSE